MHDLPHQAQAARQLVAVKKFSESNGFLQSKVPSFSEIPKRGRSKRGRTQKHVNERTQKHERKSATERESGQKGASGPILTDQLKKGQSFFFDPKMDKQKKYNFDPDMYFS